MFNAHTELTDFYDMHVRLKDDRKTLADYRDLNLERLNTGLDKIGADAGKTYAHPVQSYDQGSYAMHTLNQHPSRQYDLDHAIIFNREDLPSSACDARNRIAAAFQCLNIRFAKPPEARTNAVTVWYKEGYHIDFAVYRQYTDVWGETVIEHAGANWNRVDPVAIKAWFLSAVKTLSPVPGNGVTVKKNQLRRVVRCLKKFTKAHDTKSLPGGLIISALAIECYRPDDERDDVALHATMQAIRDRLVWMKDVQNPIFPDQMLTCKPEYLRQVTRLKDKIDDALSELLVLSSSDCTPQRAMLAWHWVFKHSFWQDEAGLDDEGSKGGNLTIGTITGAPTFLKDTRTYG